MTNEKTIICKDVHQNESIVPLSQLTFRPGVYAIIISDNKILLSKEWDGYDTPGGGVNIDETLPEALVREVKEETGFDIQIDNVVACTDSFYTMSHERGHVHSISIYFTCDIVGGELTDEFLDGLEKEFAGKAEWIPIEKIRDIKILNTNTQSVFKKIFY